MLTREHCPALGRVQGLDPEAVNELLTALPEWRIDAGRLIRDFRFPDFKATMLLVNAIACLAERENHHPELQVSYGRLQVAWSTHDVGGLSRKDFICAAKTDVMVAL